MRELLAQKKAKLDEMRKMMNAAETEKRAFTDEEQSTYDGMAEEARNIQKQFENEQRLFEMDSETVPDEVPEDDQRSGQEEKELRYVNTFLKHVRKIPLNEAEKRQLSSNTDADGKLLIPKDIRTMINEFKRDEMDIIDYVTVEPVNTNSGSRNIEKDAAKTPFDEVAELVTIPDMGSPQFEKISYNVIDFKGIMEIPNSLLKDEDAGLMRYIAKWIAKKEVATHNALVFYADGTKMQGILGVSSGGINIDKSPTTPIAIKDFKTIFNKKLPSAIKKRAKVITNQSGFNYLDSLEDVNGRPYLQPDPKKESEYKFLGKPVVVFDDDVLLNDTDKAPFIIGDCKEAYVYFDREGKSIATSKEAGFDNDSTKVRAIMRGDGKFFDKKAVQVIYTPVE